mmetsp:Transcript_8991/g.21396  ORF Transcript_8991/g.21396 Transcript_8991/m.21396 type:complete len:363 (-) Transcript_8991:162-1250(-)
MRQDLNCSVVDREVQPDCVLRILTKPRPIGNLHDGGEQNLGNAFRNAISNLPLINFASFVQHIIATIEQQRKLVEDVARENSLAMPFFDEQGQPRSAYLSRKRIPVPLDKILKIDSVVLPIQALHPPNIQTQRLHRITTTGPRIESGYVEHRAHHHFHVPKITHLNTRCQVGFWRWLHVRIHSKLPVVHIAHSTLARTWNHCESFRLGVRLRRLLINTALLPLHTSGMFLLQITPFELAGAARPRLMVQRNPYDRSRITGPRDPCDSTRQPLCLIVPTLQLLLRQLLAPGHPVSSVLGNAPSGAGTERLTFSKLAFHAHQWLSSSSLVLGVQSLLLDLSSNLDTNAQRQPQVGLELVLAHGG